MPPPLELDIVAQRVEGFDVAVNALALTQNALPGQHLHQLRDVEQMVFVGLLLKDAQQRQKLRFLSFLLRHRSS